jgi:hypothetical protein
MTVTINGTTGYTGPIGAIGDLSTTGNTTLGDAAGDTLTINGSTTTFTQGTANGVLYLNGSKVATSGSALTFDGSQLDIPAGSAGTPSLSTIADPNTGIFFPAADTIAFAEGGVEAARFDSSGNFGLGVTPSAWGSGNRALEMSGGGIGATTAAGYAVETFSNCFYNGTNWIYKNTGLANRFTNYGTNANATGAFAWYTAASGTAGNAITFTQAMTLDASGRLGVGVTSPTERLSVYETALLTAPAGGVSQLLFGDNASDSAGRLFYNHGNDNLQIFVNSAERARIDSSGNLRVGSTSITTATGNKTIEVNGTGDSAFNVSVGGTNYGYLYTSTSSTIIGTRASIPLVFNTANTERARIDSSGNFGIGTSTTAAVFNITSSNGKALEVMYYGTQGGRMISKAWANGGTGAKNINLFTINSFAGANTRVFATVTVTWVDPVADQGNQATAWAGASQGGTRTQGSFTVGQSWSSATVGSLNWSGNTLRLLTPAVTYGFGTVDVIFVVFDGASITFDAT